MNTRELLISQATKYYTNVISKSIKWYFAMKMFNVDLKTMAVGNLHPVSAESDRSDSLLG